MRFDDFELSEENAQLTRAGQAVPLPPKAFAVLCTLVKHRAKLVRKDDLLDAVWGHRHVSESVLKTTISQVRAALADDAAHPRYIETASRLGYRFIGRIGSPEATVSASPSSPMIGRKAALAELQSAWLRARSGQPRIFWIAGDAGVGKSTLTEHFVRQAAAPAVAQGQCVEQFGAGEPYLPVLQALGALAQTYDELPPMMRAVAPSWLLQMPWLVTEAERAALSRELAGASHERMVRELRELMQRFTAQRPLLLITEDLHWSDHATLQLMDHFARLREPIKLLWVGTFRLTQVVAESHPLQALRHELKLHHLCDEVLLDPFSEAEVAEYLASRVPDLTAPETFVRRLHRHTDGLPLFLANVVESVTDEWVHGATHTLLPVPEDLAGTLDRQIERLDGDVRTLLETASACGAEFQAGVIAEILEQNPLAVAERCDALVRQQFWLRHESLVDLPDGTVDSRYAFRHAIYRHAFNRRLGPAQRVQTHRRIAQSLIRQKGAAAAELAFHHEQGREYAAALAQYARAAEMALGQFASKEGEELAQHALTLLPRIPQSSERLELELAAVAHLGTARSRIYGISSDEAREALERAQAICAELPQTPQRALLLTGLGWTLYVRGEYRQARALGERVAQLAADHDNAVLLVSAANLLGMVCATRGENDIARAHLERGIAARTAIGDRLPLGAFLIEPAVTMRSILAIVLAELGLADSARARIEEALELAKAVGHSMAHGFSRRCASMVEIRLKDVVRTRVHTDALLDVAETTGLVQPVAPQLWMSGWVQAVSGDPGVGFERARKGYEMHVRMGMVAGCAEALTSMSEALLLLQDWDGALERIREGLELCERLEEGAYIPGLKLLEARALSGQGRDADARRAMRESLALSRKQNGLYGELEALVALCELPDASQADRDDLAATFARVSEGFDIGTCVRAREILS